MSLGKPEERGLVICRPPYFDEHGIEYTQYLLSDFELRKYLLYWDKIFSPDYLVDRPPQKPREDGLIASIDFSNPEDLAQMRVGQKSDDMSYLEGTGHLIEQMYFVEESVPRDKRYFQAHEYAIRQVSSEDPGQWEQESAISFREAGGNVDEGILQFSLNNLLPAPAEATPLEDILEFKERNTDNLIALRTHLDIAYQSVLSSADVQKAANTSLAKIAKEVDGVLEGLSAMGIRHFLSTQTAYLSAEFFGLASYADLVSSLPDDLDLEVSPITATAGGVGLAVGIHKVMKRSVRESDEPFRYIQQAGKVLGELERR